MSNSGTRAQLKNLLISRYASLRKKLEYIAGSTDNADDALQETWLRLEAMGELSPVLNADAYLTRMVTNVAINQYRSEQRHVHEEDLEAFLEIEDELADPERIVAARHQIDALKDVLAGLTPRRQEILLAARVEGQLNEEIARRLGISLRLVEKELSSALKHCHASMREMPPSGEGRTTGRRKF